MLVKRTGEKISVPIDSVVQQINKAFNEMYEDIFIDATEYLQSRIKLCSDLDEVRNHIQSGIAQIAWCGEQSCGLEMEDIVGTGILGEPEDPKLGRSEGACPICGKPTDTVVLMARTY